MKWTKAHSKNAVAAKARLRIERSEAGPEYATAKMPPMRRLVPDFTINIRSRSGERVQITATRWGKQFITGEGVVSARKIARGIEMLLRHCEP